MRENGPQRMVFVTGRRCLSRSRKGKKATCLTALSRDTGAFSWTIVQRLLTCATEMKGPQRMEAIAGQGGEKSGSRRLYLIIFPLSVEVGLWSNGSSDQ